jgi:putative flippase GtrA
MCAVIRIARYVAVGVILDLARGLAKSIPNGRKSAVFVVGTFNLVTTAAVSTLYSSLYLNRKAYLAVANPQAKSAGSLF